MSNSEGVGYTDYTVADIETHRSIANFNQGSGLAVTIAGIVGFGLWDVSVLLPILGVAMFAVGQGMELQALRWEVKVLREGGDSA